MASIDYGRFYRLLTRCTEVAAQAGLPGIVSIVYKDKAEAPIVAFINGCKGTETAMASFVKENREALEALGQLDGPYRVGRSTVAAMIGQIALPDTLKSQPTDTDKLNAIERLVDVIDDYAGQPWADSLLQGELGTQAPKTVKELTEAIAANKVLAKAQLDRAAAYGPAYEAYLGFKRVVRDALGPNSKEYKRIHLRATSGTPAETGAAKPDAPKNDAGAQKPDANGATPPNDPANPPA
jgi:hypothetical protein